MKSIDEATEKRQQVQAEIDRLPAYNFFGESNARDIAEMKDWIVELNSFISTGIPSAKETETSRWLKDSGYSDLNDIG